MNPYSFFYILPRNVNSNSYLHKFQYKMQNNTLKGLYPQHFERALKSMTCVQIEKDTH